MAGTPSEDETLLYNMEYDLLPKVVQDALRYLQAVLVNHTDYTHVQATFDHMREGKAPFLTALVERSDRQF